MDVTLLYFTLYNHEPSNRTTWGAIILNNGEMESFVGSGTNELESLFDGLTQCLRQIPLELQIVIRSRNKTVLQLGKKWLDTWRSEGWETEEHDEQISALLKSLENRRVEWLNPNYLDQLDKTVIEFAHEEWNLIQQRKSNNCHDLSEESSDHDPLEVDSADKTSPISSTNIDLKSLKSNYDDDSLKSTPCAIHSDQSLNTENYEHGDHNHELRVHDVVLDSARSTYKTSNRDSIKANESESEDLETFTREPSVSTVTSTASSTNDISSTNHRTDENTIHTDNLMVDSTYRESSLHRESFSDTDKNSPSQIVAYLAASHHHDLAAWSFALIDKPSQMAFFKAVGHRHSTKRRSLLQGCITLLSTIKSSSYQIECRLHDPDLASLLKRLIENPYANIEDDIWAMESAFVSQLSFWLEKRTVTIRTIGQDESDLGSQMVQQLSQERLSALNFGESAEFSLRKTHFPLERLLT